MTSLDPNATRSLTTEEIQNLPPLARAVAEITTLINTTTSMSKSDQKMYKQRVMAAEQETAMETTKIEAIETTRSEISTNYPNG